MEKILITGHTLTLEELAAVCRDNAPVALAPEAKQRILESRQVVDMPWCMGLPPVLGNSAM